jgi:hypothetical protein
MNLSYFVHIRIPFKSGLVRKKISKFRFLAHVHALVRLKQKNCAHSLYVFITLSTEPPFYVISLKICAPVTFGFLHFDHRLTESRMEVWQCPPYWIL